MKCIGTFLLVFTLLIGGVGNAGAVVWSFNQHTYVLVDLPGADWYQATADMQKRLGTDWYLATITSQGENDFVFNSLFPPGGGEYWLGGVQNPVGAIVTDPGVNWTWVTGENFYGYTLWGGGEPNDGYGPGSEEWLGMISDGAWNDEGYIPNITGYIAENNKPVPEPGTMMLLGSGLVGLVGYGRRRMKK